jgi:hypothetical protein
VSGQVGQHISTSVNFSPASPRTHNRMNCCVDRRTADTGSRALVPGAHPAAGDGSLALLQFDGALGLGLVRLGGIGGGVCLERRTTSTPTRRRSTTVSVRPQARAVRPAPAGTGGLLAHLSPVLPPPELGGSAGLPS